MGTPMRGARPCAARYTHYHILLHTTTHYTTRTFKLRPFLYEHWNMGRGTVCCKVYILPRTTTHYHTRYHSHYPPGPPLYWHTNFGCMTMCCKVTHQHKLLHTTTRFTAHTTNRDHPFMGTPTWGARLYAARYTECDILLGTTTHYTTHTTNWGHSCRHTKVRRATMCCKVYTLPHTTPHYHTRSHTHYQPGPSLSAHQCGARDHMLQGKNTPTHYYALPHTIPYTLPTVTTPSWAHQSGARDHMLQGIHTTRHYYTLPHTLPLTLPTVTTPRPAHQCRRVTICGKVYRYGVATIIRLLKIIGLFCKRAYKRDYILQKRPIILRSLLIVATP